MSLGVAGVSDLLPLSFVCTLIAALPFRENRKANSYLLLFSPDPHRGLCLFLYPYFLVLLQEWLVICYNESDSLNPKSLETGHA